MGSAGLTQLQEMFARVINISVGLLAIALTIMLVYAGIKYLISGGDAKALSSASSTLTWALLGMLFLGAAWLVLLLIKAFTGVPVTTFCLSFTGCIP